MRALKFLAIFMMVAFFGCDNQDNLVAPIDGSESGSLSKAVSREVEVVPSFRVATGAGEELTVLVFRGRPEKKPKKGRSEEECSDLNTNQSFSLLVSTKNATRLDDWAY